MKNHEGFCVLRVLNPLVRRRDMVEKELRIKPAIPRVGPEGGRVPPEVESAIQRARGGGQPLEDALKEQMSTSLGHDFSEVRVHSGPGADELNRQLSARAFTIGSDIFFTRGAYDPDSISGRELIAHELIHVVQQRNGRLSGEGKRMTVRPAGDSFEQEAKALAPIASGMDSPMHLVGTMSTLSAEPVVVQRALRYRTANINNYPPAAQFPITCLGVVLYWLCCEALNQAPTAAEMLQACENDVQKFVDNLTKKWSAKKRSRVRGNKPIIVAAGSVLFFRTGGTVAHACVMGDRGGALGLQGVNQAGWWTGTGHGGACPFANLCSHAPSEINWSGWNNAIVKRTGVDHSVYTLPGEKAVKAVKDNLGIP